MGYSVKRLTFSEQGNKITKLVKKNIYIIKLLKKDYYEQLKIT